VKQFDIGHIIGRTCAQEGVVYVPPDEFTQAVLETSLYIPGVDVLGRF
jgi:uncharacterized OB-fold protein